MLLLLHVAASVCKCVHVTVIVCNVTASKCHYCCSIICSYDYAMLLLLNIAASACMCLLLYGVLLLVNVATAVV